MKVAACVLFTMSFATSAFAGQVYGSLFLNGQPLRGVAVALRCGDEAVNKTTDADGVYRLFVRSTGNCQLIVDPNGRHATAAIYSYDRPTGYNFDLVDRNGRWELVRR
jgi:hypothetical protein